MATTVKQLIEYLNEIEDKEQTIIYQYFLAEHFEYTEQVETPSKENFANYSDMLDPNIFNDTWVEINNFIWEEQYKVARICESCLETYNPELLDKLGIEYQFVEERKQTWKGEYYFYGTRISDTARRLEQDMYRPGSLMCLSFGHGKPLNIGRGGAILLDDVEEYDHLRQMRYDGRDLTITPWQQQQIFRIGYHYKPTIEEAERGIELLAKYQSTEPVYVEYPDLRKIKIINCKNNKI